MKNIQKNKNYPKVSIITPSFNQGIFIEETIKSVIEQTYPNIEYIVIDGSSSDETNKVLLKYKDEIEILISEPDEGQSDAINKGIRLATGEFITWINSDDILNLDAIQIAMSAFMADKSIDFIYGDVEIINQSGKFLTELKGSQIQLPSIFYSLDINIPQQGSIWRKKRFNEVHELKNKWHYVMDRELFLRLALIYNFLYIPKIMGKFRQHPNSKSSKLYKEWAEEMPKMYRELVNDQNWTYGNIFNKKVLASSFIHAAYICIVSKLYKEAFNNLVASFKIYPLILINKHIYIKPVKKILNFIKN